jgi:hypothetical protein
MRCSILSKPAASHQLVHLGLAAPAHHPGLTAPVAGEGAGDEFQLGVPGLAGVDQQ